MRLDVYYLQQNNLIKNTELVMLRENESITFKYFWKLNKCKH